MAAKQVKKNTVYVVKAKGPYLLMDNDERVGSAGSRVTAIDTAKELGYDEIKEVTLEQWLELILSSE